MAPVLEFGLPKGGLYGNTLRTLICENQEYQGLGLHNIYTIMGMHQIQALFDNNYLSCHRKVDDSFNGINEVGSCN